MPGRTFVFDRIKMEKDDQDKRWYQKPVWWIVIIITSLLVLVGLGGLIYFMAGPSEIGLAQRVYDWASVQGSITPKTLKDCAKVSHLDAAAASQLNQMAMGKDGAYAVHNLCRNTAVQQLHNAGIYPELKRPIPTIYVS